MNGVLWLVGAIVGSWFVLAVPASWLGGAPREVTALAALLNLVPGLLVLLIARLARHASPIMQVSLLLSGGLLRLVFAVGVGFLVYCLDPGLQGSELALLAWGSVFYLVALAVETALVYRQEIAPRGNGLA